MSIIERALRKAQQAKPAGTASEPVAAVPMAEPVVAGTPAQDHLEGRLRPSPDANGLTARDMKRIVEFDVERLRATGHLPPEHAQRQSDEEMRRIKWPLLSALAGRGGSAPARNNVILVTSAEPSEGKSYTALNLAISMVRDREIRVILVDGDVAQPGITPTLGLEGAEGLNDVLEDPAMDINQVIYRTTVDGLFFVPAGKWNERSPELIAGSRMPQIIEDLGNRVGNGIVILDSPPLLATNEAQVATQYVGHVLMVVRADRTEQRAVLDALALIDKSVQVSAVLNGVEASLLSRYYGQYYYGYGANNAYSRYQQVPKP
jgi:exopolysaccharide/PEP-CTERM locus tyrosine autokinase